MMKTKKSKTDAGNLESGKDNDTSKSKQKTNTIKTTQVSSSPSRSNTAIQNTITSTVGDVKKKKTRNGNKVVTGNVESSLNTEEVFKGNSSDNKKKRKRDVSESTSSVPSKKPKKDSYKSKEKLIALSKKKWAKIKRKMKKKKAEQKSLEAEGEEDEKSNVGAQISSLEYLRQWKNDKSNWSFQKVRQVWLLKNMYNKERVSEEDFAILLEYLEGLQGAARKITVEKAEKIMKDADDTDDVEAEKSTFSEEQLDRVRQVLQLL